MPTNSPKPSPKPSFVNGKPDWRSLLRPPPPPLKKELCIISFADKFIKVCDEQS